MGSLGQAQELSFLLKWPTLDEETKLKQYSKYQCHELNIFLFFKDKDFYQKVIEPFLRNKMAKDFVDIWLLGNIKAVEEYKEISKFSLLNAFEKCLLLSVLVKTNEESAQRILRKIEDEAQINEIHVDTRNRVFDTVLNLNIVQDEKKPAEEEMAADPFSAAPQQTGFAFDQRMQMSN